MNLLAILPVFVVIAGCGGGTIIGKDNLPGSESAYLSAAPDTILRITPLHASSGIRIEESQPTALWLSKGWYRIDYRCSLIHANTPEWELSVNEYITSRLIRVRPGRSIELACSPNTLDVLDVYDRGLAPNNSFKPTQHRGVGHVLTLR